MKHSMLRSLIAAVSTNVLLSAGAVAFAASPSSVSVELSGFSCLDNAGRSLLANPAVVTLEYNGLTANGDGARETCSAFVSVNMIPGWKFRIVKVRYAQTTALSVGAERTIQTMAYFQGSQGSTDYETTLTGPVGAQLRTTTHNVTGEYSRCGGGRSIIFNPSLHLSGANAESEIHRAEITLEWAPC